MASQAKGSATGQTVAGHKVKSPTSTPAAEVEIDEGLLRRLLKAQHPDLAKLPLQFLDAGWDNVMVRLGSATDLASLWMLFAAPGVRAQCLRDYGADDALRQRAMGWAVSFAAVLLDTGRRDHPRHAAMGRRLFKRLNDDAREA